MDLRTAKRWLAKNETIQSADVAASLYTVTESSKRVGLHPTEYFKYLITGHWHGREAMTPAEYSIKKDTVLVKSFSIPNATIGK